MRFGIDYASKTPDAAALRKGGVKFVCRYVSTSGNPKNIDAAEVKALKKAGVDVVIVFETSANRALDGFKAGAADAHAARQQTAAVGLPKCAIYFAVDFDLAPAQEAAVKDYFKGVASVLGKKKAGVYGGFRAVSAIQGSGIVKYGWQTYAWSYGKWHAGAQLRQVKNAQVVCGVSCDHDHAVARDFGQSGAGVVKKAARTFWWFVKHNRPIPVKVWKKWWAKRKASK